MLVLFSSVAVNRNISGKEKAIHLGKGRITKRVDKTRGKNICPRPTEGSDGRPICMHRKPIRVVLNATAVQKASRNLTSMGLLFS